MEEGLIPEDLAVGLKGSLDGVKCQSCAVVSLQHLRKNFRVRV